MMAPRGSPETDGARTAATSPNSGDLRRMDLGLVWLEFALALVLITYSGSRLARHGQVIATLTGLGGTWIGLSAGATCAVSSITFGGRAVVGRRLHCSSHVADHGPIGPRLLRHDRGGAQPPSSTACAAASRAIGTRKGEQDT